MYAKLRVRGDVRTVLSRGVNLLVERASGARELRSFDTHGDPAAEPALFGYLESLEPGALAVLAVSDEASARLTRKADLGALLGSQAVLDLGFRDFLAVIARKARGGGGAGAFAVLSGGRERARDGVAAVCVHGPIPRDAAAID